MKKKFKIFTLGYMKRKSVLHLEKFSKQEKLNKIKPANTKTHT